jgi:hypothetical protein
VVNIATVIAAAVNADGHREILKASPLKTAPPAPPPCAAWLPGRHSVRQLDSDRVRGLLLGRDAQDQKRVVPMVIG